MLAPANAPTPEPFKGLTMKPKPPEIYLLDGRRFTPEELSEIQETVKMFSKLSLTELVQTICEHMDWLTPTGTYKIDACRKLLEQLEARGKIRLPEKNKLVKKRETVVLTPRSEPQGEIVGELADIAPVSLEPISGKEPNALWSEFVERYHYLGYKRPFGVHQRYFIRGRDGTPVGCLLMAGASKLLAARERWIGWTASQRYRNIHLVVNNSRFLILPWVHVKNLASHALALLVRRIGDDWETTWGYRPVLLETFVDVAQYQATCYRAANWIHLGETTGRGQVRPGKEYSSTPKALYVYPLTKDFRKRLCADD
jgi:hypothetical protein